MLESIVFFKDKKYFDDRIFKKLLEEVFAT